ncbi:MAG TPA: sigma-70 family RNA polymerase sigma factor [Candidatus Angelobacter sp.]|jgi:RNA polymerase sigma-70 factor (ECF subfamily)
MDYRSLSCDELVRVCARSGNAEAWLEFVSRFQKLITAIAWRVARRYGETSDLIIEDLVQETYVKVCADSCRLLREFQPHHPDAIYGMLKVTTTNVVHDYFRASDTDKRGGRIAHCDLSDIEALVPSNSSGPEHTERLILLQEVDDALQSLSSEFADRDREIFWLYHRQSLTAREIAEILTFGLTTKGVESILHRLKNHLRARFAERSPHGNESQDETEGFVSDKTLLKGEGQP